LEDLEKLIDNDSSSEEDSDQPWLEASKAELNLIINDSGPRSDQKIKPEILPTKFKEKIFAQKRNEYEGESFTNEVFKVTSVERTSSY
jgi:hypothetical protein